MKKPYVVDVTETLFREVIVWAEDDDEAYDLAEWLCNTGYIDLDAADFNSREITIEGIADDYELCFRERYGNKGEANED